MLSSERGKAAIISVEDFPDAEGDMSGLYIEEAVEAEDLIYTPEPRVRIFQAV